MENWGRVAINVYIVIVEKRERERGGWWQDDERLESKGK